jgi:hypothetical protein
MDEEHERKPLSTELLNRFATTFTMIILVMTLTGILISYNVPDAQEVSTLFALGRAGLPYNSILQLIGLAFILAVFTVLLFSERFNIKMRFISRFVLLMLSALIATSIFGVVFKWFPANDPLAWIGLVLSFVVCSVITSAFTLLYQRLVGKKYNKLLADYKARRTSE